MAEIVLNNQLNYPFLGYSRMVPYAVSVNNFLL